jgi:hypothetical protein
MAIFHLRSQIIKRTDGRSSVACAAYRSGEALYDEREGETHEFARQDRVVSSEIIAPAFAQDWARDRAQLWNSLEAVEKRKDAQLCQELEVALPNELPRRLQKKLLAGFIDEHFTQKGFVVDVNIHNSPIGQADNDHAHLQRPLRAIDPETGGWKKTKDRQESKAGFQDARGAEIEELRASWAKHVNLALADAGIEETESPRVDHRSHKRRGITDVQPGIHVGYAGKGIEERGGHSWRAAVNREIHRQNRQILEEIKTRVAQAANAAKRAAATIAEGFQQFARGPGETAPKPAQKPVPKPALQPPPMRPDKLAEDPPPVVADAEAEKRKKAAHLAAMRQLGGGSGVGS